MEISKPSPLSTGGKDLDKVHSAPETIEFEENGNIATIQDKKVAAAEDSSELRPVDQFFTQQARGDILSPIKPKIIGDDDAGESLDLKLDDTSPRKPKSACVQPESFLTDNTDMFEVNILEASVDSKLDTDQSETELMNNEGATSRKRPQTEMEPAVFEVPRMTKHPHTDAPPVPEFREDSEPLIDFASETENVFRVALPGENGDESAEPMSFQENSQITQSEMEHGSSTYDLGSATFVKDPVNENTSSRFEAPAEAKGASTAPGATDAGGSAPETKENAESPIISIVRSIDEALDPLVRAIFPIMRRGTGLNTAFVCIPLLVASISYLYLRL